MQKVVWSEGMFLTPHLFQQADGYHESVLYFGLRSLRPFPWGLTSLELDRDTLPNGDVTLVRCSGIMPDGLALQVPDEDTPPESRSITAHFSPTVDAVEVYLAIPVSRPGALNVRMDGGAGPRTFRYETQMVPAADETSEGNEREIPIARKNLKLLFSGESLDDTTRIKIAEVRRARSGTFELNEAYVPPALSLAASATLLGVVHHVLELLAAKSHALSQQRRHMADFGTSDMANFWLLHTVNSTIPILAHCFEHVDRHPEELYLALARLAGELSTFALGEDPRELPRYDHTDLGGTFGELEKKIRFLLETVIPTRYVLIPLERTADLYHVGRIQDERLLKTARFYLAANAEVPVNRLIDELPAKTKISSPDQISDLIGRAVRGVELTHEPVPPTAIPVRTGFKYFHLSPHGKWWDAIGRAKGVAIYIPDEFPDVRLELVAIKE
jgi:type VI secretion system protein ImpJ